MAKRKISLWLILGAVLGYLWILISINHALDGGTVCIFKNIYGIPCPSCGSTHGVIALFSGELAEAFRYNPNSYILAFIMIFIPFCAFYDLLCGKELLYNSYKKTAGLVKRPAFLITFFTSEAAIWGYKLAGHFGWI